MTMKALLSAALLAVTSPALAQNIVIENGKVWTMESKEALEDGDVWIRGDAIAGVGKTINGNSASQRFDASGLWVTPGIINAFSRLGAVELNLVSQTRDDGAKSSDFSAGFDVAYGLNPASTLIAITRMEGITRAASAPRPRGSIFGGYGAVIDLSGQPGSVMQPKAFMLVQLGESGAAATGGARGAAMVTLRQAFEEAGGSEGSDTFDNLLSRIDVNALKPVVRGDVPLFVEVNRASDILTVLDLKKDYRRLNLVLAGVNEGWLVADAIAAAGVPVISDVTLNIPDRFETIAATLANAGRMNKAGVKVVIASGPNAELSHNARLIMQLAGNAVANGMPWVDALAATTARAADVLGIGEAVGTLTPGKQADVVIWDGDPLEITTRPVAVFINGQQIPLTSRQTLLRNRYRDLSGDTPFAYRK